MFFPGLFDRTPEVDNWAFSTNGAAIMGRHNIPCVGFGPGQIDQAHTPDEKIEKQDLSTAAAMYAAIKFAKYNELTENDYVVSIATDSMQLYGSRLSELTEERGAYSDKVALQDIQLLDAVSIDHMKELDYYDKKAIHNLKYYTWIEQQGKDVEELNAQWYDHENFWGKTFKQVDKIDALISEFNDRVGLI